MKKLIAFLILVGCLAGGGILAGSPEMRGRFIRTVGLTSEPRDQKTWHTTSRPTYASSEWPAQVSAPGRVEPDGGVCSVSGPGALRIQKILVSLGDTVKEGDELAYLEGRPEQEARIKLIEVQLAEADELLQAEAENEAVLQEEAELEREQLRRFETPESEAHRANIELLGKKLANSEKERSDLEALRRDGRSAVSAQELEHQRLIALQDRAAVNNARADFEKYKAGQDLKRRRVEIEFKKGKSASTRARLAVHKKSLGQQLELAKEQLKQTVVVAPRAGRVLRIQSHPGEMAGPAPILQIGDTRRMYVVTEVDENQIAYVAPGQTATIHCPGLRDSTFYGVVESKALMVLKNDILGLDPAAAAYTRVVEVKVKVNEPCDPLRDLTNAQVRVGIDTPAPPAGGHPSEPAPGDPEPSGGRPGAPGSSAS